MPWFILYVNVIDSMAHYIATLWWPFYFMQGRI